MSCKRYDISLAAAPRDPIRLLYISKSRFGGDWHSTPHTHNCTELFYCVHGMGQFNIEGTLHGVATDDLVIVNPMVEHTELSLNANPLEYVVLGVEGVEFLFNQHNESYTLMNCRDSREEILFLFQKLLREVDDQGEGCETICQDLLEVLMIWLIRANNFSVRPNTAKRSSKECAAAKRYLDEHFAENITLDALAEVTHINKYYLAHTFTKEYKISPINYLIRKRIDESKSLLRSTDYSLSEISSMMGFSSASYFSQSFRKLENTSPTEYRRSQKDGSSGVRPVALPRV